MYQYLLGKCIQEIINFKNLKSYMYEMKNNNRLFNRPLKKLKSINLRDSKNNELMQSKISSVPENLSQEDLSKKTSELDLIIKLYKEKKYSQTIEKINIFIKTYPNDFNAKNILALSYKYLGNLNKAISLFQSLIAQFPRKGFLSANLGRLYYDQGKRTLAIEQYKRCITIDPSLLAAYTGLSNCYIELGQSKDAISVLKKVLDINPKDDSANYNLGNVYRKAGRYKEAIPYYANTDIHISKSHQLECFYLSDDKENFYKNLKQLEEKKILNPLAGCLSSHSSILYARKNNYSFCEKPLNYIVSKNLLKNNSLNNDFMEEVNVSLRELNLDFRNQALLKKGTQSSGNIFMSENKIIDKLKSLILKEIKVYKESFHKSSDGFIKSWPEKFNLYGWVVNISNGGSLDSHIHKEGWMSGSLYFSIPKKILPNDGNIAFSMTGGNYPTNGVDFEERVVETSKGGIVLFPSSLFHRTIPFRSDEERMTIAFDVMPN